MDLNELYHRPKLELACNVGSRLFSGFFGTQLGHITAKYTKLKYESDTVKEFEIYLTEIGGFKEAIWKREKLKETEREKIRAKEMV